MSKEDPLCPGEWLVELKLLRRIRVGALDAFEAKHEAVNELSNKDRKAVSDVRIVAGRYEDGSDYKAGDDWWAHEME